MEKKIENRIAHKWCEICGSKETDVMSNADGSVWAVKCKKQSCLEERRYESYTPTKGTP